MLLLVVAVLVGFVAGRLRSPAGARTPRIRFEWIPLLGIGAGLNLVAYVLDGTAATLALAASLALLLGFVGVNTHVTGLLVIGLGLLLNLVAVVVNNGMPVRGGALVAAGVVDEGELATTTFAGPRHLETSADTLPVLGDVLPLPVGGEVMSFGDLLVVFGAGDALRDLARRRRRRWSAEARDDYRSAMGQMSVVRAWGEDHTSSGPPGAPGAAPTAPAPVRIDLTTEPPAASSDLVAAGPTRRL